MNDEEFNELFEHEDLDDNEFKEIEKKINRRINRRIYIRVIAVMLIISIILSAGFFGTSYGLNLVNYNPEDETGLVIPDEGINGFNMLTGIFLSMYFPGVFYDGIDYNNLGFGNYTINAKMQPSFSFLTVDGIPNTTLTINRSSLEIDSSYDHIFSRVYGEYYDDSIENFVQWQTAYNLADIEELPESAILDVSLSFANTISVEEVIDFVNNYNGSRFVWLATGVDQGTDIATGISLSDTIRYDLNEEFSNKYPGLYFNEYKASDIVQSYLSRMKLLLDHKDFLYLMYSYFSYDYSGNSAAKMYEDLSARYEDAMENGVSGIGVRVYVKKQDLLTMIDSNELYGMYINDVKFSRLQR